MAVKRVYMTKSGKLVSRKENKADKLAAGMLLVSEYKINEVGAIIG